MDISCIDGSGTVQLSDNLFDRAYNEPLVHQLIVSYMAGGRQGTHAQKTRAMVSGGGRKPWRQKGTGRARSGTNRSPIWRGGGKVFAKEPRDYSQKLNKKMYQAAMQSVVSELMRQERLSLIGVESLNLAEPKTKEFKKSFAGYLGEGLTAIVVKSRSSNLDMATRNIPNVAIIAVSSLDPVALVHSSRVLMDVEAAKELESLWQ